MGRITSHARGVMLERTLDIFADYFQFLVEDSTAGWEDVADRWTPEAVEAMFIER